MNVAQNVPAPLSQPQTRTPDPPVISAELGRIELDRLVFKAPWKLAAKSFSAFLPESQRGSAGAREWATTASHSHSETPWRGGEERADHSLAAPLESDKL